MLKTTSLVAGHYECRSLDETLPVFTDLLAMEVVKRKPGEATLKHPNTDWRLILHEGGPNAPEKAFDNPGDRILQSRRRTARPLAHRRPLEHAAHQRPLSRTRLSAASLYPRHAAMR